MLDDLVEILLLDDGLSQFFVVVGHLEHKHVIQMSVFAFSTVSCSDGETYHEHFLVLQVELLDVVNAPLHRILEVCKTDWRGYSS